METSSNGIKNKEEEGRYMICDLCKKEIDTKKEKYVHVEDFDKEEIVKELWAHRICFNKAMNRELNELEAQAKRLLNVSEKVYSKLLGDGGKEEYVLR